MDMDAICFGDFEVPPLDAIPSSQEKTSGDATVHPVSRRQSLDSLEPRGLSERKDPVAHALGSSHGDDGLTLYGTYQNAHNARDGRSLLETMDQDPQLVQEAALTRSTAKTSPQLRIPQARRPRTGSSQSPRLQIRDSSRARSQASPADLGEPCVICGHVGQRCSFCNVCQTVYCDGCWIVQPLHKQHSRRAKRLPHEKTDHHLAEKVNNVLRPNLEEKEIEQLHINDMDTTWFGVVREDHDVPLFRDYGRYASIIAGVREKGAEAPLVNSISADVSETLYPSLVSFVGQTGAGKSTLIKLLIDLNSDENEQFPTPVVGAVGKDVATSEDVHLYLDPASSESQAPLLFADCEGLEGGGRDPIVARLKRKQELSQPGNVNGVRTARLKHTSERELTWADTPLKRSREFAVAHLYPRLLYTFSDVIVFVLKNPRAIEGVLKYLVDWAAAALEKSSNQPVLPHAIIALNASDNGIDPDQWSVETATQSLMESLSNTVYHNAAFKSYAQFWRERGRSIETVQQLVESYYSSIRVVRIPENGRPNLINDQVQRLSNMIRAGSTAARQRKLDIRMLLDADEFQPYLQVAFDHFAQDLNTPFDFVQASFANSPIPQDFGGNILKLGLQVMEFWKGVARAAPIFEELSYIVASSIVLDAARHKILGEPEQIFPQYLEHLENALENFCDRHWPCEFVDSRRLCGRCVNVRSGHGAKGHQSKSGKLLAAGDYVSAFTFKNYRQQFQEDTYRKIVLLRGRVRQKRDENEDRAAAEVHREIVLPLFFEHASRGLVRKFVSHSVCFSCLFNPPEHALPCGHIICTTCLKAYGKPLGNNVIGVSECPLERSERRFRTIWRVHLKPANAGIRILTLDGGGVRGIVELETLRYLEKELGGKIRVQSFFDLVVGTSTGGIIALALTVQNCTVDECIRHFEKLCAEAFCSRPGMGLPLIGWLISNFNHSRYETEPLEAVLMEVFTKEQLLFGGQRSEPRTLDIKVAVTSTSAAGHPVVLANYNRVCTDRLNYHFQRPESQQSELKTWEAARATSAAPTCFRPLYHEPAKQLYSDGSVYHNNPIRIADQEWKLIWPSLEDQGPDVVVSLGTQYCSKTKDRAAMQRPAPRGMVSHARFLRRMAVDHVNTSLDSERTWKDFLAIKSPRGEDRKRYVRINPETDREPCNLDETAKLADLRDTTRLHVADSQDLKLLARQLVATCFYFEETGVEEGHNGVWVEVSGYFRCRFTSGYEIAEIGRIIQRFAVANHPAHFLIKPETDHNCLPQEVLFDSKTISTMIQDQRFSMRQVSIRQRLQLGKTEISLCYTKDTSFPISGFPRCLLVARPTLPNLKPRPGSLATSSIRWASKSNSQQQRRIDWKPPQFIPQPSMQEDAIARYADATHVLGNASQASEVSPNLPSHNANAAVKSAFDQLPAVPGESEARGGSTYPWQSSPSELEGDRPPPPAELPA